jgi:hypothetical protein
MKSRIQEKINEAQRLEILRVYREEGTKSAIQLCLSLGLCGRYYSSLASSRGVAAKKRRPLTDAQKAKMRATVKKDDSYDYRWKWAIERGPVVAP